jgi:predicted RNase H-like HicB family nuclease
MLLDSRSSLTYIGSMRKKTREKKFSTVLWKEGRYYIAQCLNVDVSSFGATKKEATSNIREALELYFEGGGKNALRKVERP